jgi:hypothetical protein
MLKKNLGISRMGRKLALNVENIEDAKHILKEVNTTRCEPIYVYLTIPA